MNYGYDLSNPKEKEKYLKHKQEERETALNTNLSAQEKYNAIIKSRQQEIKEFAEREEQEQELTKELEKEAQKIIETMMKNLKMN